MPLWWWLLCRPGEGLKNKDRPGWGSAAKRVAQPGHSTPTIPHPGLSGETQFSQIRWVEMDLAGVACTGVASTGGGISFRTGVTLASPINSPVKSEPPKSEERTEKDPDPRAAL